jgi:hypothetical protein
VLAVPQAVKTGYALVTGSPLAPVPERSYDASGASIVAAQTGTGTVQVTFTALGTSWPDYGTVTVSAVGANNANCAIDSWGEGAAERHRERVQSHPVGAHRCAVPDAKRPADDDAVHGAGARQAVADRRPARLTRHSHQWTANHELGESGAA